MLGKLEAKRTKLSRKLKKKYKKEKRICISVYFKPIMAIENIEVNIERTI